MEIKRVWKIYWSATDNTRKLAGLMASTIASELGVEVSEYDFTLPKARESFAEVKEGDLVVFGMPTFAGRLPNLMLPYLDTIQGNGALAVPFVTYGNRNFDNSLIELRNILEAKGFHTVAGAAYSCEHSFSYVLGAGRPDSKDLALATDFAKKVAKKVQNMAKIESPVEVDGDAEAGYFKPQDRHGNPINILKVKPKTNENCVKCGLCVKLCPMGAINPEDPSDVPGKCVKCNACFKHCPMKAKYFDDEGYLLHKSELEYMYAGRRAENKFYL